jgi:NADH-quinone oxidoreductase subunit H
MWVRWTLPRLRIDQVMMTCLKYLLPISCGLLLGVSLWQVLFWPYVGAYFSYALVAASVALVGWLIYKLWTTPSRLPVSGVPPLWGPNAHAVSRN